MTFRVVVVAGLLALPGLTDAQVYRRVDPTPLLRLRGVTAAGALSFAAVSGATRLSNGTIVVGDPITASLHFFDSTGVYRGRFGREGDGPGEFRHISWIGSCDANEVHVWDLAASRVTVVSSDRRLIRQFTLPSDPGSDMEALSVRCSPDGTFAFIAPAQDSTRTIVDETMHFLFDLGLADSTGRVTDRLPRVIGREFVRVRSATVPKPLSRAGHFAIGRDRVFVTSRDGDEIAIYSRDRRPMSTIRLPVERRRATRSHLEAAVNEIAGQVAPTLREQTHAQLLQLPMPENLPPRGELFVDPSGVLWVVASAVGDPRTRLLAFSAEGRPLGESTLPSAVTIYEVGADYILGSIEDDLGEQSVVRYRLYGG